MDLFIINSLGVLVFLISSIVFFVGWKKKQFNSAFFVSGITLVSYAFMLQVGGTPYLRWLGYIFSCTLLVWVIGQYIELSKERLRTVMFLTPLVMLTGALASLSFGFFMLFWFVLGGLFYVALLRVLLQGESKYFDKIKKYIWFGWTVFPVVFIVSPEGFALIPMSIAMGLYLLLDIYTKIIFYKTIEKTQN